MTDKEKTGELLSLIDALCDVNFAKEQNNIDGWVSKLNKVYSNEYRHTYSDIFFKIQQIMSDTLSNNDASDTEVLEVLGENLNVLGNRIDELAAQNSDDANYKNTVSGYKKFSDHIRLEIGRYNFIKSRFTGTAADGNSGKATDKHSAIDTERILKLERAVDATRPIVAQAQKQLDSLDEKLESNKISSITTLTIFSAVILAFSGGITFESGIFQGMVASTSYRLVFTIILYFCGIIYLLGEMMQFLWKRKGALLYSPIGNRASCGDSFSVSRRKPHDRECFVTLPRQGSFPSRAAKAAIPCGLAVCKRF